MRYKYIWLMLQYDATTQTEGWQADMQKPVYPKFVLGSFLNLFFCMLLPLGAFAQQTEEVPDPFESVNRAIFSFNETLDTYFLEPVARGYDFVVPDPVESSIGNFLQNLRSPIYIVSDLLQGRFHDCAVHTTRFLVNSTIGVVGIFDVAKEFDLEHIEQDFGLTLGRYGVAPGPYIVLPILGPSSVRDASGMLVDLAFDPTSYTFTLPDMSWEERLIFQASYRTLEVVNTRSRLLTTVDDARGAALDYYLFVRSAYWQYRTALVEEKSPDASDDTTESIDSFDDDEYIFEDDE